MATTFLQLFRNRLPKRSQPKRPPRRRRYTLRFETLESRVTPSILGTFELDGNATTGVLGTSGSTTTSHDWDQVFADAGSPAATGTCPPGGGAASGATACSFVTDAKNTNADDIFQGGGSKDTHGIQEGPWLFTGSRPQPKDDITHAYAAAYTDASNGDLLLYAGLDRFDNSGDSTAGFWFFKNQISENPNVNTGGGHPFVGTHADGDVLLVSDFTIGGSTSTIKVFRWTGNDATGSLVALNNGNPIGGNTFAIVNSAPTSVPWSYTNKSGQTQPAAGEFLEEGVDLSALGLQGCFSTFLAETRSSQSPTATLSDFTLGKFNLCGLAAPQFQGLSKVGDPVTYPLTVQNTGSVTLYLQNVSDTLLGNIVSNGVYQAPVAPVTSITPGCGASLAPGASCTILVTRTVQAGDPDPTPNTVTFVYNSAPDFSGNQVMTSVNDLVNLFQPSAAMTETASPATATMLGQVITYTFTVSNTSSFDSPHLVLSSFTDSLLGDLTATASANGCGDLAPETSPGAGDGQSCTFTVTRPIQAGDPTPLTDTSNVAFTLAQNLGTFTNVIRASASASVTLLPHLAITKAPTNGIDMIHPGDTASFTITVSNDGAGPATNVLVTDALPDANLLAWTASSSAFTTSIDSSGFLTATDSSLPAGASATIVVSAVVPLDFFGTSGGGTGNGDPVPLDLFELDGNATTGVLGTSGSTTTSHDWDQVFADSVNGTSTSGAVASSFVTDLTSTTADDIFQGGGSKDTNGIQEGPWQFTDSKPQGKDDIAHAFAATYTAANGDQILYAGLDRFDNSGDSTAGFWFFRNPVSEGAASKGNGTGPFVGTHADGDILLVSDFTVGGSTSTIKVFRWTGDDATGSLVALNSGNPIGGSTFAIVNGAAIPTAWPFTNKSKESQPAAGEFLEEGINLTALGLQGCFSTFLAETRSSQSPTATLSDFTTGKFNTCMATLPNTATVQADGIPPITSNEAVITITLGQPQLAAAPGRGGAGTDGLTAAQLQPAVAQAINLWRAAGLDPQRLSALDNFTIRVAGLPDGELGWALGNNVWIDRTAAGWGWSLDGSAGRMDLVTVVSHELGHVLGFDDHAGGNDVMTTALAAGMRRLPEAPGSATGAAAPSAMAQGSPVSSETIVQVSLTSESRTPAGAAPAVPGVGTAGVPSAATVTVPGASGNPRGLAQVLLNVGPQAPPLLSTAPAAPAAGAAGADRDSATDLVPGLRPPVPRVDSGGATPAGDEEPDAVPDDRPVPPVGAPVDAGAADAIEALGRLPARDAFFAGGLAMAGPGADSGETLAPAALLAVLGALGGHWSASRPDPERRRRFLS
jgi:uncharacterized repeat protein (TIGR01451 family)